MSTIYKLKCTIFKDLCHSNKLISSFGLLGRWDRLSNEHVCPACVIWITSRNSRPLFGPQATTVAAFVHQAPWHRYQSPYGDRQRTAWPIHIGNNCHDELTHYQRCFIVSVREFINVAWSYCFIVQKRIR